MVRKGTCYAGRELREQDRPEKVLFKSLRATQAEKGIFVCKKGQKKTVRPQPRPLYAPNTKFELSGFWGGVSPFSPRSSPLFPALPRSSPLFPALQLPRSSPLFPALPRSSPLSSRARCLPKQTDFCPVPSSGGSIHHRWGPASTLSVISGISSHKCSQTLLEIAVQHTNCSCQARSVEDSIGARD